jgi:hypothetical protein
MEQQGGSDTMKPEYPKRMLRTRGHHDSVPADQAWARDAVEEEKLRAEGFAKREEEEQKKLTWS